MKRRPQSRPATKQPMPEELLGQCLSFLQRKFYENHADSFAQDRQRLLKWVVLWPAKWLDERGVSLPLNRYRDIFMAVFMDAAMFQAQTKINYLPAYLRVVLEKHFAHHGEDYYDEAKSIRAQVDTALQIAVKIGKPVAQAAPDPIRDLARAARLVKGKTRGNKTLLKPALNDQLNLL
jgi:hypothetical protein